MRYSAEHKQQTRSRILGAAGRMFRAEGYGGSGIDGLTKAAGVTNGAFYGHFKTKGEAFREAVLAGLEELRMGIAHFQATKGTDWLKNFVAFYMGPKRTCDLGETCALPTLSPEVVRADDETRAAYETELRRVVAEMAAGLSEASEGEGEDEAIALLALLSGGLTIARAVPDPVFSNRIANAVRRYALAIATASAHD